MRILRTIPGERRLPSRCAITYNAKRLRDGSLKKAPQNLPAIGSQIDQKTGPSDALHSAPDRARMPYIEKKRRRTRRSWGHKRITKTGPGNALPGVQDRVRMPYIKSTFVRKIRLRRGGGSRFER